MEVLVFGLSGSSGGSIQFAFPCVIGTNKSWLVVHLLDSQIKSLAPWGCVPFHPAVRSSCVSVSHSRIHTVIIYLILSFKILS